MQEAWYLCRVTHPNRCHLHLIRTFLTYILCENRHHPLLVRLQYLNPVGAAEEEFSEVDAACQDPSD